jgi:regulator of replication initiation timing
MTHQYQFFNNCEIETPFPNIHPKDDSTRHFVLIEYQSPDGEFMEYFAVLTDNMLKTFRYQHFVTECNHSRNIRIEILIRNISDENIAGLFRYLGVSNNLVLPDTSSWKKVIQELEFVVNDYYLRQLNRLQKQVKKLNKLADENDSLRIEVNKIDAKFKKAQTTAKAIRKQRNKRNPQGYVYLLRVYNSENLYKIGRTHNPDNRLRTFNVKLPFPVAYEHLIQTDDMYQLESELHARYAQHRQNGSEFFTLTQTDIDTINQL